MKSPNTVFISHAAEDRALADALSDLLIAGIGLTHDQIFCTSLAGLGIPAGTDFKAFIQKELENSSVVIALLTPNYYASAFCLCELGGTWVLSKDFLPFVTPLAGFGDLKAVLKGVQAIRLNEDSALDEMRDRLQLLTATPTTTPRWSMKKAKFLSELNDTLAKSPKPTIVSATDLAKTTAERDGYMEEVKRLETELETLKRKYDALGKCKGKSAKQKIDLEFSDESEQFEALALNVKKAAKELSRGVEEALFYRARGDDWFPDGNWDGRLVDDIERNLLKSRDGIIEVNESHPKIRPVITALWELNEFVTKASPEFYEAYEDKYQDELSFDSRGFWERHIC
jgi:hypothetical protein